MDGGIRWDRMGWWGGSRVSKVVTGCCVVYEAVGGCDVDGMWFVVLGVMSTEMSGMWVQCVEWMVWCGGLCCGVVWSAILKDEGQG